MMVRRLGGLAHLVDERERGGEVLELVFADDLLAVAVPLRPLEAALDLLVVEQLDRP